MTLRISNGPTRAEKKACSKLIVNQGGIDFLKSHVKYNQEYFIIKYTVIVHMNIIYLFIKTQAFFNFSPTYLVLHMLVYFCHGERE